MWSIMKNSQDNDVIDYIGVISIKYNTDYQERLDSVWSMMKMRQDNDVTNRKSPLYAKNETKLSCPIW